MTLTLEISFFFFFFLDISIIRTSGKNYSKFLKKKNNGKKEIQIFGFPHNKPHTMID